MAAPRQRRRRARLTAVLLVLALALAAAWVLVASRRAATRPPAAAAPSQAPAPAPPVAAAPEPPAPQPVAASGEELPEPVRRYLEANEYPPTTGLLGPGNVDLLEPNRRYERPKPVPDTFGETPPATYLWTADRYAYTGDEVVHARFEAKRGESPAPLAALDAWAQPEGDAGAVGPPVRLAFRAEQGAHVSDLDLGRVFPDHHGPILLGVRFALAGGEVHEDAIRIATTPVAAIPARFTGSFRDLVRDGSLVVEVGIDVREGGFYRVDANLYDTAGAPVAWTAWKGELRPSDGSVPLEFFGKVLRDAGVAGPYRVGELRGYRFLDGQHPDRERLRDLPGRWPTRPWTLADFSDAVWTSAHKAQMVRLLLEDARAGRTVQVPPLAVPGAPAPEPAAGAAPSPEAPAGPSGATAPAAAPDGAPRGAPVARPAAAATSQPSAASRP